MKTLSIKSLALALVTAQLSHAALAGTGTTAANFLKISPDSRSAALGGTGAADAASGFAAFHTPAIPAAAGHRLSLSGSQTQWILNTQVSHYAADGTWATEGGRWGLAATVSQMSAPSFQTTDASGKDTGRASYGAQTLGLSLSRAWGENVSLGAGVKKITEGFNGSIGAKTSALGYDAGAFVRGAAGRWSAGAVVTNLGSASGASLPTAVRAGLELAPGDGQFCWTAEAAHTDAGLSFGAGMGFRPFKNMSLRAGYDSGVAGAKYAGLTSGLGFSFGDLTLDYSFSPFGDMGNVQRVSVSWALGGGRPTTADSVASRRSAHGGERRFSNNGISYHRRGL
jgi:hypothetical protein